MAVAVAAIVAPALTACSSDKSKKAAEESAKLDSITSMVQDVLDNDSATAAAQEASEAAEAQTEAPAAQANMAEGGEMPYDAKFFNNTANKAATVKAGEAKYAQTPSGLKYVILRAGSGAHPTATDVVTVNYAGRLTDMAGTEFDSSYKRGEPTSFPLNRVIPGWTEGLQLMQPGAVYEFYIPADLAYGERGGGPIPPNAPLLFKVELISIGNPQQ